MSKSFVPCDYTYARWCSARREIAGGHRMCIRGCAFLLLTAQFHDLGFVEQPQPHELISARMTVHILATALLQAPQNLLEQILAGADLHVFERDDLMLLNANLRRELVFFSKAYSYTEWYTDK